MKQLRFIYVSFLCLSFIGADGQDSLRLAEDVAVVGRPSKDSISLRWAPVVFSTWEAGNALGYTVERYTVLRNGSVLNSPEKITLTGNPLKPFSIDQWESLVKSDKYAAVAAQAIFGERFEVDLQQTDVFQIVNKVKENDQRFSFALFCADMSPAVAQASGLLFTDLQVKPGEKYLYRVVIYQPTDTLRGSIYISPDDPHPLSRPEMVKATFQDAGVSLQWNRPVFAAYTAYSIERSTNGIDFSVISDVPLITVSPNVNDVPFEIYTDSLQDPSQTYFYRIHGITPFGEYGEFSDVVSGRGVVSINDVPMVTGGDNVGNQSILLHWEFPVESNTAIEGFVIERSMNPKSDFRKIQTQLVGPTERSFEDKSPDQVNYYRVAAQGLDGKLYNSPIYLSQLIDSLPPVAPAGLKAIVNDYGRMELSWQSNSEKDIYGYRIYRSNGSMEELFQVTTEPISFSQYVDTVNLNTLNENVYYTVMAIDKNQNHSQLSQRLKVPLPDKIKPQPPVFLPVKSDGQGTTLQWERSGSTDVVRYDLYRQKGLDSQWIRIRIINTTGDSTYQYVDTTSIVSGQLHRYTVIAVDEAGLESDPSSAVRGARIPASLKPAVSWNNPVVDRTNAQIILNWEYNQPGVESFRIYRAKGDESMILYKSVSQELQQYKDKELLIGEKYTYKIMAVFKDGGKSSLSRNFNVTY